MENHSEKILTVSEYLELLNEYIKPINFSIIGEVSSVTDRSGGAVFFNVSDEEDQAVLNCVIWRNVYKGLGFKLEEGMQIKMSGEPNIYKPRGQLSYVAHSIIPTGEGALLKAFEELKKKLQKEGFFAAERKQKLPSYITKIGLVTAKQSDAIKDFEKHLGNFGATVYVYDVRVEGFQAVDNIVKAIENFNKSPLASELEVLVLTRGGGSLESLQAFNSEAVAKAVYASKIPVLSAIGHERDITISDLTADIRGSTPTDAGKILSKDWREGENKIKIIQKNLISEFNTEIITHWDFLEYQQEKLLKAFEKILTAEKNKLRNFSTSLFLYFQNLFHKFYKLQKSYENQLFKFEGEIKTQKRKLNEISQHLIGEYRHNLKTAKFRLQQMQKLLNSNNPKRKLEQGYTLTRNTEGKIIKSANNLNEDDILDTYFIDGEAKSKVTEISKNLERRKED